MNTSKDREGWPTIFLNAGTRELGVDCSALISTVSQLLASTRKETLAEVAKERELVLDLATIIRSNIKSYKCGQHKKLVDKCNQVLSSLSVEEGKEKEV